MKDSDKIEQIKEQLEACYRIECTNCMMEDEIYLSCDCGNDHELEAATEALYRDWDIKCGHCLCPECAELEEFNDEPKVLTMDEIAEKFDIPVKNLKIKKD